jgi:hypothetical protein
MAKKADTRTYLQHSSPSAVFKFKGSIELLVSALVSDGMSHLPVTQATRTGFKEVTRCGDFRGPIILSDYLHSLIGNASIKAALPPSIPC